MENSPDLLNVNNLSTYFFSREGILKAVDGVSFTVRRGETLGIAGESGCGKSVMAQSIMRIVPANGRIVDGEILLHRNGETIDLVKLDWKGPAIRQIRGGLISMVFQEPMTSFSMNYTIGNQIAEVIRLHQGCDQKTARERTIEILRKVGLPKPEQTVDAYPFALSGGMRQRAMIAMALACQPSLLIADEPTTALDVTIQAQVLELMQQLQQELGIAYVIVANDLGLVRHISDKVIIMHQGRAVETGNTNEVFANPQHEITKRLISSYGHEYRR